MKKTISIFFTFTFIYATALSQVKIQGLLTENRENPIGIDILQPQFSWQLAGNDRDLMQIAYEIRVSENPSSFSKKNLIWDSEKTGSDSSVHVTYKGPELKSGKKYYWQVRAWDNKGKASSWSETAFWQMGLLHPEDWKAKWIEQGFASDESDPSPLFRKKFASAKKIKSAFAYITAHGLYEAWLNGKRIGDAYLTPGWTSYNKRLQYQVYDVAGLISNGDNIIGATLGNGWYRGYIGFSNTKGYYGKDQGLLFQLDVTYTDGSSEEIISDETWKSSTGAIKSAEIYNGESIDARDEKTGWLTPKYDDAGWSGVKVVKHETFKPVRIITTPKGEKVIDFGQNLVGWVSMKVKGNAGDKITISHAEVLDKEGNFYTDNLRAAKAQDVYILKGGDEETFEPHFTFHGFQYIKVEGYPGELMPENFTAVAL